MALMVVAVMAMAMTAGAAFAAGTSSTTDAGKGKITVENAESDATYTAYKIFDVTYADNTSTEYAYTISTSSPWYSAVNSFATAANGLTLTASAADSTVKFVTIDESKFSAADFAAYLRQYVDGEADPADISNPGGTTLSNGVASNLALGYWFVTTTTGSLCNLTTTDPEVTIFDKNVVEFDKTVDDEDHSIYAGQTVTYTLSGVVPSTTGYTKYTYKVEDSMTSGLTLNQDVKIVFSDGTTKTVVVGTADTGETAYSGTDPAAPTVSYVAGTSPQTYKGFSVEFDMTKWQAYVNQDITITYTATVNENAIVNDEENNKAKLTYSNNPSNDTSTDTMEDEEHLYSFNIVVDKYESGTATKKLANAQFALYKTVENVNYYYYYNETNKKVEWIAESALSDGTTTGVKPAKATNITLKTTDSDGATEFDGLEAGTYYLLETKAPDGYNLLASPVTVVLTVTADNTYDTTGGGAEPYILSATVDGASATVNHTADNAVTADKDNDVTAGVANSSGTELPSTGGMGTTILYIVGGIMVLLAGVYLVTKRRMGKESNVESVEDEQ